MRYDKLISFAALAALITTSMPAFAQAPAGTARGSVRLPEASNVAEAPAVPTEEEAAAKKAEEEKAVPGDELVYLNVQDEDVKDVIRQISKATGRNFIIDDKVRGKVTIMSEKMMTKEEAYQAFLSALEVAGFTTVTGPGGIIKVVSLKEAASSPIPIHVDSTPYTDSFVTRLIKLQNISALDMSNAIKGLISKSGNMFAYPATNTLIITDSGTNIDRLMKIIKELDQEGPQQVLEIIPIYYADAREVAATVLSLFEIQQQKQATRRTTRSKAAQLEDIKDVSKIIADERTNSLIVLASKRAIKKVVDIIEKLDMPLEAAESGKIHVHYLKYANAPDMAATLAAVTSGAKAPAAAKGAKGAAAQAQAQAAVAQLEGGITIGADESTNALIITATAKDYKILVDELISKLDIPRRQVFLEAVVMELEVFRRNQAGASGYAGAGSNSILGFGSYGFSDFSAINGMFDPTGFFATPGILGGLLSRDTVTISVPSSGGGTTDLTIPSFAAFLNFIQTYRDANIVSTPNLMTLDNQKASIEVTRIQYATKTTVTATAGTQTIEPYALEAGLTLEITPQISEGDAVRLEINNKLSNFTGDPGPSGAAPQTKRTIQTTVVAMDGQTVVLGGLMEDLVTHDKAKVPILGDIPLIGWLFKSTTSSTTKNNLLIFITPHVLRDPSDFAEVSKSKIESRNRFIQDNYGKKQQRSIYETIAMHRSDLLAFTPYKWDRGGPMPPAAAPVSAPAAAPAAKATSKAVAPAAPTQTRQPSGGPVITVPPPQQGPSGVLESSKTKPVVQPGSQSQAGPGGSNLDLSY
jgi:general secretion pathway protein D